MVMEFSFGGSDVLGFISIIVHAICHCSHRGQKGLFFLFSGDLLVE